jgi:hypothetical protein
MFYFTAETANYVHLANIPFLLRGQGRESHAVLTQRDNGKRELKDKAAACSLPYDKAFVILLTALTLYMRFN